MKLLKAMATIASFTMISRIAGMVRDMLTASYLGAGPVSDAFFVALKLPNFFRRVAAEGAFSVSFIPLYAKVQSEEGEEAAAAFSGNIFSLMILVLSGFTALVLVGMPWIIHVIAPGFADGTERYHLAVSMTRLTFPYLVLMSATALFGGMLNTHHKFAPFAAAPILFNLTLIVFVVILARFFPTAGHAMAVGVTVSGVLQMAMMIHFLRRYRIAFRIQRPRITAQTRQLFKAMGPGVLSAGVFQIHLFVNMMMASLLPSGAISHLYYADRLTQLPLGLAGVAVGTALLPLLSTALAARQHQESQDLFNRALEFCFFIALPATVALLVVPYPMVGILFERGQFSAQDTLQTSYVVMGYGIGLPAYIASKIFMTAFWAHHDTMTPVRISILTTLGNVAASLFLIGLCGVAGIALATGLSGWAQVYLLHRALKRQDSLAFDDRLRHVVPKIALCSCFMGIVLSILSYELTSYFQQALPVKILALLALLGGGAITYAVAVQLTGVLKISDIQTYMTRSTKG